MSGVTRTRRPLFRLGSRSWAVVVSASVLVLMGAAAAAPLSSASAQPRTALSFTPSTFSVSVPFPMPNDMEAPPQIQATLTNSGAVAARGLRLTLPRKAEFTISAESCPLHLTPGQSCSVTVRFTPTGSGISTAALEATSSARGSATLELSGVARDDSLPQSGDSGPPCEDGMGKCIIGTEGPDYTYGSIFNDQQYGLGGDDDLHGSSGDDYIKGGDGNDTIHGNLGSDTVVGDYGNDLVHGNDGDDFVYGGAHSDMLYGEDGDDYLSDYGSPGAHDTMNGGSGNDSCWALAPAVVTITYCEEVHFQYP